MDKNNLKMLCLIMAVMMALALSFCGKTTEPAGGQRTGN